MIASRSTAPRRERDRRRVGVGVAERAGEPDLARLDEAQRDGRVVAAAHADEHRGAGRAQRGDAVVHRLRMAGALDQHVGLRRRLAGLQRVRRARPQRQLQPVPVDVGHDDLRRAPGRRGLGAQLPDRPGSGDEHAIAGADAGPLARPQRDRQRLHQRAGLVAQIVGQRVREVLVHGEVAREGAVGRRRAEELDVLAEVVDAGAALAAAPARQPGLERHAVADAVLA